MRKRKDNFVSITLILITVLQCMSPSPRGCIFSSPIPTEVVGTGECPFISEWFE